MTETMLVKKLVSAEYFIEMRHFMLQEVHLVWKRSSKHVFNKYPKQKKLDSLLRDDLGSTTLSTLFETGLGNAYVWLPVLGTCFRYVVPNDQNQKQIIPSAKNGHKRLKPNS